MFTGIHSFFTQWYLTLISLPVLTFIYFSSLSVVLHLLVSLLFPYGISFLLVFLQGDVSFTLVSLVMVHHIQFSGVFLTYAHFSSCDISPTLVSLVIFHLHLFLLLRYFTYTHFSCCGILPTLVSLPVVSHTELSLIHI